MSLFRHLLQLSELANGRISSGCNFCVESKIEKYSCYLLLCYLLWMNLHDKVS